MWGWAKWLLLLHLSNALLEWGSCVLSLSQRCLNDC